MEKFNASIGFDFKLAAYDVQGSLAHVKMLAQTKIISSEELQKIRAGLFQIQKEIENGTFKFSPKQEDIHMAIEGRLAELIGETAGKLHSARSRNDQVALDTKLFVREKTKEICQLIRDFQKALVDLAQKNQDVVLPGYTHLQRAQPILLAHHYLAYFEMLERDRSRFNDNLKRLDQSPLGAGALAGTSLGIDRDFTAKELGFAEPTHNSLDSVSDRDFVLDFLSATAICQMHLSRLSEEWVLWSSQEFGFITLPQGFCTGSSMMPQKINPDAPELIRGKTGRVFGNLLALLTTMKALPLSYNKDMQEDKEPLFDSAETLTLCLQVLVALMPDIRIHSVKMRAALKEGFVLATDAADYLVKKGLPFRETHELVGKLVQLAQKQNCGLEDLPLADFQKESKLFAEDIKPVLNIQNAVEARKSFGGTAKENVRRELERARKILKMLNS